MALQYDGLNYESFSAYWNAFTWWKIDCIWLRWSWAAGDHIIIIDFLMEKGEGREKWSSSSSGPPSEGSEYSVANHHYYQKYELIYQHRCTLEAWHTHILATEKRLHALIAAFAVHLPSPRPKQKPSTKTPFVRNLPTKRNRGGLPTIFTNAIVAKSTTVRNSTPQRLP